MSKSSQPYHKAYSCLPIWCISIFIGERLSAYSVMKTRNRTQTAGVRTLLGVRSSGSLWRNGSGISAWNSDMHCTPRPCARRNLLRHRWVSQRRLYLIPSLDHLKQPPSSMDRRTAHVHLTPQHLLAPTTPPML